MHGTQIWCTICCYAVVTTSLDISEGQHHSSSPNGLRASRSHFFCREEIVVEKPQRIEWRVSVRKVRRTLGAGVVKGNALPGGIFAPNPFQMG